MLLDLSSLHSNTVDEILIDEEVSFPYEMIKESGIKQLDHVKITGKIIQNTLLEDVLTLKVTGKMLLEDSISLEDVFYPFSFDMERVLEEIDKKDENTLDLLPILWENIILEIPLKFTKVQDLSKFHGDGWKLISEEERKNENNPFSDLLDEFGKE